MTISRNRLIDQENGREKNLSNQENQINLQVEILFVGTWDNVTQTA